MEQREQEGALEVRARGSVGRRGRVSYGGKSRKQDRSVERHR